jgi:hypothetical protein
MTSRVPPVTVKFNGATAVQFIIRILEYGGIASLDVAPGAGGPGTGSSVKTTTQALTF